MIQRLLICAALAGAVTSAAHTQSAAQPAAAMGKPLPDGDLPTGNVSVRVVQGTMSAPAVGMDVSLSPASGTGTPRISRTDAQGRANFVGLTPGSKFVARVVQEDPTPTAQSEAFAIPSAGGLRLLLSTIPWKKQAPSMPRDKSGRPDPRQMSGRSRPDRNIAPRQLNVRVLRGTWDANAEGIPVHLVGYDARGKVTYQTAVTDAGGRVRFQNLTPLRVAYYVRAMLPRQNGADRLVSSPITALPNAGVALLLAGNTPDSTGPATDDLMRLSRATRTTPPPGEVLVSLDGRAEAIGVVRLFKVGDTKPIAEVAPQDAPPSPDHIAGQADKVTADDRLPKGSLLIDVKRHVSKKPRPAGGIAIEVADASGKVIASSATEVTGVARFDKLPVTGALTVTAIVHGKRISAAPFSFTDNNGRAISFHTQWQATGGKMARFTGLSLDPTAIYYARADSTQAHHLSVPFQMATDRGAALWIFPYLKPIFSFRWRSEIDDESVSMGGVFRLQNVSHQPYEDPEGGVLVPLPRGFKGAGVGEQYEAIVVVDKERGGFVVKRAIPPGGEQFHGGFRVDTEDGVMQLDVDLPYGAFDSQLVLPYPKGAKIEAMGDAKGSPATGADGKTYYTMSKIFIDPRRRISLRLTGLPEVPLWRAASDYLVGILVLALLIWAVFGVASRRVVPAATLDTRRAALLDTLVALEQQERNPETERLKEETMQQLEDILRHTSGPGTAKGDTP